MDEIVGVPPGLLIRYKLSRSKSRKVCELVAPIK